MRNGKCGVLTLWYHGNSNTTLDTVEQEEFRGVLEARNVVFDTGGFPRRTGPPVASIVESLTLILILSGALASKQVFKEIVKDLYGFFKGKLTADAASQRPISHFAVILDVELEGQKVNVGIDFRDEATLVIGCFRLHAYLDNPSVDDGARLVELEYPKAKYRKTFLDSFLATLSFVIVFAPPVALVVILAVAGIALEGTAFEKAISNWLSTAIDFYGAFFGE